jgi:uncharacterized membrane protein YqiK
MPLLIAVLIGTLSGIKIHENTHLADGLKLDESMPTLPTILDNFRKSLPKFTHKNELSSALHHKNDPILLDLSTIDSHANAIENALHIDVSRATASDSTLAKFRQQAVFLEKVADQEETEANALEAAAEAAIHRKEGKKEGGGEDIGMLT